MFKVGITGGIGSGKTTVVQFFQRVLGISIYHSDSRAKELYITDDNLKQDLINTFGEQIYLPDGSINRLVLAKIVFSDEAKLKQLNAIVHPAVERDFLSWCKQHSDEPYILKEAALLFESSTYKNLDCIYTVSAPIATRISRVIQRDGLTEAEVMARLNKQWTEEERIAKADGVIINDSEELLIPQLLKLHEEFITKSIQYHSET